ncbi:mCG1028065, isoform CRA_a, partial [Mus musculus]
AEEAELYSLIPGCVTLGLRQHRQVKRAGDAFLPATVSANNRPSLNGAGRGPTG